MSMIARFVQVQPSLLQDLLEDPSSVETLFEDQPVEGAGVQTAEVAERMRKLLATRGAAMVAGGLPGFNPKMREALNQRLEQLGVNMEALKAGQGGEALADLLMSRMGMMRKGTGAGTGGAPKGRGAAISLDKAWHGVHYLLCGSAVPDSTPLGQVVMGGTEIGDDFSGYGEARYFAVDRVADIARELGGAALEAQMQARFVPAHMESAGIYPGGWGKEPPDWLFDAFHKLRDFYAQASAGGFAVLTCLV